MRGGSGNRVIPLQSTRFCSYVQFFFAAPFVSLSFFLGLCFFSFSVRFRDEQEGGKTERERETNPFGARVTHARSAFILPAFPSKPGLPTRDIYIYILYFRRCFAFVFHRTMKETLRTICSLYFSSNRRGKNFHLRM